eukprot:gene2411-biopygen15550
MPAPRPRHPSQKMPISPRHARAMPAPRPRQCPVTPGGALYQEQTHSDQSPGCGMCVRDLLVRLELERSPRSQPRVPVLHVPYGQKIRGADPRGPPLLVDDSEREQRAAARAGGAVPVLRVETPDGIGAARHPPRGSASAVTKWGATCTMWQRVEGQPGGRQTKRAHYVGDCDWPDDSVPDEHFGRLCRAYPPPPCCVARDAVALHPPRADEQRPDASRSGSLCMAGPERTRGGAAHGSLSDLAGVLLPQPDGKEGICDIIIPCPRTVSELNLCARVRFLDPCLETRRACSLCLQ